MSDPDIKEKVSKKRKRNMYAKKLRDSGDMRGAFALKVISPKKPEYKREKLSPRDITTTEEDSM